MKFSFFFVLMTLSLFCFSQEKPVESIREQQSKQQNKLKESMENQPFGNPKMPTDTRKSTPQKNPSAAKSNSNSKKPSKSGKHISIKNTKGEKEVKIFEGEKIIVKTKDGEKLKGVLNKIKAPEFAVGDSIVELNKVLLIKRGFLPVLKKKSSGLGLFLGGVVITAAGTFIGYASTLVFEEGGPFIIVTAVGITTAIGVDIVGVSVAIEGVKLISQKVKWPIGDNWKASLN
jgi:small nuclear ribonucleoprotein (snRNP)-like protein